MTVTTHTTKSAIEAGAAPTLTLTNGMVGFPQARSFVLSGGADSVFEMECLDEPGLGFVMIEPGPYFPDYAPIIDDLTVATLGLTSADEALLLLVVTLGDDTQPPCANLMAPVVVNTTTKYAAQVVLAEQGYALRAPFLQD